MMYVHLYPEFASGPSSYATVQKHPCGKKNMLATMTKKLCDNAVIR